MSNPQQLDQTEIQEKVPQLPLGPSVAGAAVNAAVENQSNNSPRPSHSRPYAVHHGSRSRVDVDFFDPEGVDDLRRTLSRSTDRARPPVPGGAPSISRNSDDTAFETGKFDFEKVLRDVVRQYVFVLFFARIKFKAQFLISRIDESGIERRELGVMFKNLRVVGLGASARHQSTLGSVLNPLNILKNINASRHPALRDIISGFEGCVRPGEMLREY